MKYGIGPDLRNAYPVEYEHQGVCQVRPMLKVILSGADSLWTRRGRLLEWSSSSMAVEVGGDSGRKPCAIRLVWKPARK